MLAFYNLLRSLLAFLGIAQDYSKEILFPQRDNEVTTTHNLSDSDNRSSLFALNRKLFIITGNFSTSFKIFLHLKFLWNVYCLLRHLKTGRAGFMMFSHRIPICICKFL